ncbi:MAG: LysE family translocator [Actinobacteria bacterium]|nr:LysE family translocator [Actinomycetota bacterium]
MILLFIGTCLLLAMVPGPGAMIVLRQLLAHGRRSAVFTLVGNELSLILWGIASGAGLAVIIASSPTALTLMRVVCAALLVLLGTQALWTARKLTSTPPGSTPSASHRAAFQAGLLANMTNPKAAIFSLSFLPQFVPEGFPPLPTEVGLAVIWAAVDTLWFGGLIWFLGSSAVVLDRPAVRSALTVCAGVALVGLGVRTMFGEL